MSEDLVETLRRATVEIERQAAVEGWTMDEIRKAIEDKWAEISKNDRNFKFVDKSGRAWENGRYCQMLARTTATRVWNDSFLDRLAEEGFNLVKVSSHGSEPDCDVCRAWSGVICVISGKSDKYPTVEEARQAGVFHPNCMCTWEYVDEDEDRAEIERQGKAGKVDWNDLEAVERRNGGGGEGRDGDADGSNDAGRLAPAKDPEPFSLDKSLEPSPELVRFMGKAGVARQKEPLDLSVTNPGFGEEFGRHDNCTHCVVAGFLRLHGYDVIATPTGVGESYNAASYWKNAQKSELSLETLSADINEKMQEMGDGTIAMVRIPTSAKSTNGHVFLAMNSENGVFFYDCQTGNSGNCDVTIANAPLGSISHAWIMRIDNDVLTEQAMPCFTRNPNPGGTSSGQES
jgi:hypothetical protein